MTAPLLRPAGGGDAAGIAAVYRPYVTGSVASFELTPPTGEEIAERMHTGVRKPWWVAERDGEVVGYAYASQYSPRLAYRWTVGTSVYLRADEQRRGTGRALYEVLLPVLADLGYVTAYAGITLPNPASVALHERVGFGPVGVFARAGFKDGAWHDAGWWQRSLGEAPVPPGEPLPWTPEQAG